MTSQAEQGNGQDRNALGLDPEPVNLGTTGAGMAEGDREHMEEAHVSADEAERLEEVLRRSITTKTFLDRSDPNFIMREIAPKPAGTRRLMGFIAGEAFAFRRCETPYQDKMLESVEVDGDFTATIADTGELFTAAKLYLPIRAGAIIEKEIMRGGGQRSTEIDISVGLLATGDPKMAFEWIFGQRIHRARPASPVKARIMERQAKQLQAARLTMIENKPARMPAIEASPSKA